MVVTESMKNLDAAALKVLGAQFGALAGTRELGSVEMPQLYQLWTRESVRILNEHGYPIRAAATAKEIWSEWDSSRAALERDESCAAQARLLDVTLRALPRILTGEVLATDVLFPGSSPALIEGVYRGNPVADFFNATLASIVGAYVEARQKHDGADRLRILEIGAGTGGTTAAVLRRLERQQGSVAEYGYTDISVALLSHGRERLASSAPYLQFRRFNVEEPLAPQGIPVGAYDVVIAANVLHATRNLRRALRNAKAALKRNGLLLLNEMTAHSIFAHLTFGLLPGWWRYDDAEVRIPGTPALTPESWRRMLETEGFSQVTFPVEKARGLGQQIIVAQSDGSLRQERVAAAKEGAVRDQGILRDQGSLRDQGEVRAQGRAPPADAVSVLSPLRNEAERRPAPEDAAGRVRQVILANLSGALKIEAREIDPDDSFADYGLDSISGVRTVEAINAALAIELQTTSLFDYPTVNKLAAHILAAHRPEWDPAPAQTSDGFAEPARVAVAAEGPEPIAIIGMSGRYPGSPSLEALWQNLAAGRDLTGPVTRWELPQSGTVCPRGGFLSDIDQFDPVFFGISGTEAAYMDPQQRLFLQEAWRALEDAGYAGEGIAGTPCGVYVGCGTGDYIELFKGDAPAHAFWGNAGSITAARISYHLDLKGPAIAVDTACSSSLVAMHLACQGLWNQETRLAVAGGVFIQCTSRFHALAARAGMLSSTGRCHAFDDRADGFVPGEGVGVVVLKRLSDARADGDHIHGVIRASGINQDGATNGITAPSALSQQDLENEVYDRFGVDPESIQLAEAHGTGTKLGDPIEWRALTSAFRQKTARNQFCALGSIKTNMGHAVTAAGVASVHKVLLSLKHRQMPPSLHFATGNSHIDMSDSPFFVNTALRDWPVQNDKVRTAVVSSFGFSGTNAHIVLEEGPPTDRTHVTRPAYLVTVSARTPGGLREQVERLCEHLRQDLAADCGNVAYTLAVGRRHLQYRLACVAGCTQDLTESLQEWLRTGAAKDVYTRRDDASPDGGDELAARVDNQYLEECSGCGDSPEYHARLAAIAHSYVQGAAVELERLFADDGYCRVSLPTYAFENRRCWASAAGGAAVSSDQENKAVEFYAAVAGTFADRFDEEFLTFCPFEARIPSFSITRVLLHPEKYPREVAFVKEKQREMRRVLYYKEDFARIGKVFDIGCGHGTDLIQLAGFYPHLRADGFTITPAQARLASRRVTELQLGQRVRVFNRDSAAEEFPDRYDLVIGIEVSCHIRQKDALFGNIARALVPGGRLLMADFVSNLLGPIEDRSVEVSVPTASDLCALLARHGLMLSEVIDVSPEVAHYTHDPDHESNTRDMPKVVQDQFRVYAHQSRALEEGWISYCLLKVVKAQGMSVQACLSRNAEAWQSRRPYAEALSEMLATGGTTHLRPADDEARPPAARPADSQELLSFAEGWESRPLTRRANVPVRSVVCLLSEETNRQHVREALAASDHPDVEVTFVSYGNAESLQRLLADIKERGGVLDAVLYMWALEMPPLIEDCWQIALVLKALATSGVRCERVLLAAQAADDISACHAESWVGFERSIAQVLPATRLAVICEESASACCAADMRRWAERLTDELHSDSLESTLYRDESRHVLRVRPLPWSQEASAALGEGSYWIIGGLGGLGFQVAQRIAGVPGARLALTGRSPLSEVTHEKLRGLEDLGAQVFYVQGDVSDIGSMRTAVAAITARYGRITGVIHAAGIANPLSVLATDKASFMRALSAKVGGTLALSEALCDAQVDFLTYFSSTAAILGDFGSCDYAIGNRFQTSYAIRRAARAGQTRTTVINWPVWEGVGMAQRADALLRRYLEFTGQSALSVVEGLVWFERLLRQPGPQHIVVVGERAHMQRLLERAGARSEYGLTSTHSGQLTTSSGPTSTHHGHAAMSSGLTSTHSGHAAMSSQPYGTLAQLKRIFCDVLTLRPDDFADETGFSELGIDSVNAVGLLQAINGHFGLTMPTSVMFEFENLSALATHVSALLAEAGIARSGVTREPTAPEGRIAEHTPAASGRTTAVAEPTPAASGRMPAAAEPTTAASGRTPAAAEPTPAASGRTTAAAEPTTAAAGRATAAAGPTAAAQEATVRLASGREWIDVAEGKEDDIAIVGLSCRCAGANNASELWALVARGADACRNVDNPIWLDAFRGRAAMTDVRHGAMTDVECFDAEFFNISPAEAQVMDVMQRVALEECYRAIEDAGYAPRSLGGEDVGVIIGAMQPAPQHRDGSHFSMLGQDSSILAARLAYFLDLKGPSLAINTACSSSLVAVDLACRKLRSREVNVAIAGGVTVFDHPGSFISMHDAGMLSLSGRCRPFDEGADGIVVGDGVGMVVLKRLSDARRNNDYVYAVIRGSGTNQDGRTSGITVPSFMSQAALEESVYRKSRLDVEALQYIEAHGTGTKLGDPIEVHALSRAFARFTSRKQFCAIGSLKANIGHTGAAAGVLSLIKVCLAMERGQLPPSINWERPNGHIDFPDSPVYVNANLAPWPVGPHGTRIAAVSAFGFSGTNAHLVLERPTDEPARSVAARATSPALVVLSARNDQALRVLARQLAAHIEESQLGPEAIELQRLAYTLQVGRDAMAKRTGFLVASLEELRAALKEFAATALSAEPRDSDGPRRAALRLTADESALIVDRCVARGDLGRLLELWNDGMDIPWGRLYGEAPPQRISLPAYPFVRERYPLATDGMRPADGTAVSSSTAILHPLLHTNSSDLRAQRFTSLYTGKEFYLRDHTWAGRRVLPSVCYLEMALVAVQRSLAQQEQEQEVALREVVWLTPLVMGEPHRVHIEIAEQRERGIAFEIYSDSSQRSERVLHARGRAETGRARQVERLDLQALGDRCDRAVDTAKCYDVLSAAGLEYGPAYRGLEQVRVGRDQSGSAYVLAKVRLPDIVRDTLPQFCLHPSLLEGALQACAGLLLAEQTGSFEAGDFATRASVPFALEQLEFLGRGPEQGWVYGRVRSTEGSVQRLDADICDDTGLVCVRVRGLALRGPTAVERSVASALEANPTPRPATSSDGGGGRADESTALEFRYQTTQFLKRLLSGVLKLPPQRIEAQEELEKYGIDSVLALKLVNELEGVFGALPKTLMFEYRSISALADYFQQKHREVLQAHLQWQGPAVAARDSIAARDSARPAETAESAAAAPAGGGLQIAIVGLSGSYPQARNIRQFWENLRQGKDCVTEIPAERWDHGRYFDAKKGELGKSYSKWGGFIEGVDRFDARFFNISPKEAEFLDPQERLFVQCAYETLEDAGYTRAGLRGRRVGVFVGVTYEEYQLYGAQAQMVGKDLALGGTPSSIANRVSYFCDFQGPSLAVDTACSSSLTALHLACRSLVSGECEVALAGGVNVSVHPNKYLILSQGQFASSTGRCESFGEGGDGYVPGEGVGAVLLKPLARAIADGDQIYGVIRGTSVNHGGKTNGYTVPNPQAQSSVVLDALKQAGVHARTVSYVEAHGTGTALGDPIEIAGLTQAYEEYTAERQYCAIGSVKSNIGHAESAAGISGLTKVLLQMRHAQLVPSLHSQVLNRHIDFDRTPFRVQRELQEWVRPRVRLPGESEEREYGRVAGLSSFGAGGSNAHVIVEEYREEAAVESRSVAAVAKGADVAAVAEVAKVADVAGVAKVGKVAEVAELAVVLSARTAEQLRERARDLLEYLEEQEPELASLAYTLQVGREAMEHRLGLIVRSVEQLRQKLRQYLGAEEEEDIAVEGGYRGEAKKHKEVWSVFAQDEELQQAVQAWVAKGRYEKVLELWVNGLTVRWEALWETGTPRRISLPTYPFARDRCWTECADLRPPQRDDPRPEPGAEGSFSRERIQALLRTVANDQLDVATGAAALRELLRGSSPGTPAAAKDRTGR